MRRLHTWLLAALAVTVLPGASAQAQTVRIAKQYGISYLPLTIMEERHLLEQEAKKLGITVKTEWVKFTAGAAMNDAITAGTLDIASGGVAPLLTMWSKTRDGLGVKALAALNSMPLYLNSSNAKVKTLKDFTDADRIALPAVKTSIQAVTLQMATEQAFGPGQQDKLDGITVSLGHPEAMAQMMNGRGGITAHFASAPFMYQELDEPRVHLVLSSYDVLGGPHTFNLVWATSKYVADNPKVIKAFMAALDEAIRQIGANPKSAAADWMRNEGSKLAAREVETIMRLPENEWTTVPKKIMAYAEFMARTGMITKPANWQEVFFDTVHDKPGS
jgi:NitT/TauT family transport system substrate-binding protein